jgi:predicted metal-binding protein
MTKAETHQIDTLIKDFGYSDYKWINPKTIIVAQWVRMKCAYGCTDYGRNSSCPPNTPSVIDCGRFFDEYSKGIVFHFEKTVEKPEDRKPWSAKINNDLLKLEKTVFLAGYPKTFLLFMDNCHFCADCSGAREKCNNPEKARPTLEGMAVDVFSTVRQYGYPINVLSDYNQTMNRYALLLIE